MSIKRDLCRSKETYVHQKRPSQSRRAARYATQETTLWCCQKRPMSIKRDVCTWNKRAKFQSAARYATQERALWCCQKRPMSIKRDVCTWKETYVASACARCDGKRERERQRGREGERERERERFSTVPSSRNVRGGGLGSRPKKMYGERLGDGVEYHLMKPTPRR